MTILLTALLLTLVLAVPASAGRRMPAEGTITFVIGSWDSRTATDVDGKCIVEVKNALQLFEGTLVGEGRQDYKVVAQGPCVGAYPGAYDDHFWIKGVFEGEVDGREGTCRYVGHGQTWAGTLPTQEVRFFLHRCRGGLKGMRGRLLSNWEGEYSGWVQFAHEH
jgi:hypothetical protein